MALRLFVLLRKVVASQTCIVCKNSRTCNYSTLASAAQQKWSFFAEESEEESSVYKHALMFKRPSTIKYKVGLRNSVSLIGNVQLPLRKINTGDGSLGVHTMLKVKTFSHPTHYFRIQLKMWDKMAEAAMSHLKPNDFIYVCGCLASYEKAGTSGVPTTWYEVKVNEINYVVKDAEVPVQQTKTLEFQVSDKDDPERLYKERLHLWQVFFANPYEWIDFRKTKKNPKHPDFKHKNTGESLWLSRHDPPWISRQLQFLDSVTGHSPEGHMSSKLVSFFPENDR